MIIKGGHERTTGRINASIVLMLVLVTLIAYKMVSREDKPRPGKEIVMSYGFEEKSRKPFDSEFLQMELLAERSDDEVFSGNHALKIDNEHKTAFALLLLKPQAGKRYQLSVWTKNPHPAEVWLTASSPDSSRLIIRSNEFIRRNGDYWDERAISFQVPGGNKLDYIKLTVQKGDGPNAVYIDDIELRELQSLETGNNALDFEKKTLEIYIDKKGVDRLAKLKKKSISQGLIYHDESDIKINVRDDGVVKDAKLRLKGDWLDHISGYPSYRIEMDDTESWNGMQSFSVQEPMTRGMIRNWVFTQILDLADVLYPRTDFIMMKQNSGKPFVFSFEEHFTKNLLESQDRREGPIMKFVETEMWDLTRRHIRYFGGEIPGGDVKEKSFWSSDIKAFKEKKILNNPALRAQLEIAQNLMLQYKFQIKPPEEIFDLDRMARYLALVDICLAHHALTWHNQRFYYNPVTSLLEPVGFDGFTPEDPDHYAAGIWSEEVYMKREKSFEPLEKLLDDERFVLKYFHYLYTYSNPTFIKKIMDDLEAGITVREHFLQKRFPSYSYDRHEILDKAKRIRRNIYPSEGALRVYTRKDGSLDCINNHSFPIIVFSKMMKDSVIVFPGYQDDPSSYINVKGAKTGDMIMYSVAGLDSIFMTSVSPYPVPSSTSPRQKMQDRYLTGDGNLFSEQGDSLVIRKGVYTISEPVQISRNKPVRIEAGAHIKFRRKGMIVSFSTIDIEGEKDKEVIIESIDGKGGSISVLQADGWSYWSNAVMRGMNTQAFENWKLTGAVSFYESDVSLEGIRFEDNRCEDALNIIKSEFEMRECSFKNTFGDAFDADFCTGSVSICRFESCGNDAMDFSGSIIGIYSSIVDGAGDKGISVGEMSRVDVEDCIIRSCPVAVASKDMSVLKVSALDIDNCKTAFSAYQKKPEYGPSRIILGSYTINKVEREFVIENQSIVEHAEQ